MSSLSEGLQTPQHGASSAPQQQQKNTQAPAGQQQQPTDRPWLVKAKAAAIRGGDKEVARGLDLLAGLDLGDPSTWLIEAVRDKVTVAFEGRDRRDALAAVESVYRDLQKANSDARGSGSSVIKGEAIPIKQLS
jgi:hypothetical protein